jgi:hydroxyacyl-ACP dehydratase HTD2-like protein with hotdog domain
MSIAHPTGSDDAPTVVVISTTFTPTELELFMFCAITWNTHRIHYDREYARTEGYPDLVVPGPLQTARAAQMLEEFCFNEGGRLRHLAVRHRLPVYCHQELQLSAELRRPKSEDNAPTVEALVRITDDQQRAVTTGRATLEFPDQNVKHLDELFGAQ